MNLEELYRGYASNGEAHTRSKMVLDQAHWISSLVRFDPKTGKAMPLPLTELLRRAAEMSQDEYPKDRVWHIVEHSRQSLVRLIRGLSEEPRRENVVMPIRSVRELDTTSFVALSRRSGRTIREKLSDKPYMMAVRRYLSVDTPENRLLKAYAMRIADILEMRKKYLNVSDDLLMVLRRWLRSDEAASISRWENLPPNNTLISHRDYRRIWDSWRWLQTLNDDVSSDYAERLQRQETMDFWRGYADLYSDAKTWFAEQPVEVFWSTFDIEPWDSSLCTRQKRVSRSRQSMPISDSPACVDMSLVNPAFFSAGQFGLLRDSFVWQSWSRTTGVHRRIDISLFGSDAIFAHPDATTIASADLFFSKKKDWLLDSLAANAFANRLSEWFDTDNLVWLTPDSLNEFDLDIVRRSLNARFANAEPLPASVAAVLENIDYEEIDGDGYSVAIVDTADGKTCVTILRARYDADLEQALPETRGFIWERDIPRIAAQDEPADNVGFSIAEVSPDREWSNKYNPHGVKRKSATNVVKPDDEGVFDRIIGLYRRPVKGGARLADLQSRAAGATLWRNRIPELMTKVFNELTGQMEYFYFVGKGTTVEPVRDHAKKIPIDQEFVIPTGKTYFELYQGTNESTGIDGEVIEYVAFLRSPDMPFESDVVCRLSMTYTYGADDPYTLVFHPLDRALNPIRVEWRSKSDIPPENVAGPGFPKSLSWMSLRRQTNPKTGEPSDFLDWALESGKWLVEDSLKPKVHPKEGELLSDWKTDRNGMLWANALVNETTVWIHEGNFVDAQEARLIGKGGRVFFFIGGPPDRRKGFSVSTDRGRSAADYLEKYPNTNIVQNAMRNANRIFDEPAKYVKTIHSYLYVPFIKIWADGRTLRDAECPYEFKLQIETITRRILELVQEVRIPTEVKDEYLFLLCCMGDDMPESAAVLLADKASSAKSPSVARSVGFALGSANKLWQKSMLEWVLSVDDEFSLRILSNAAWRSPLFIEALTVEMVKTICPRLMNSLNITQQDILDPRKDHRTEYYTYENTVRYLELVLALLRTRESKDPELRGYLQPHQKRCQTLFRHVMRLSDSARFCKEAERSRIRLELPARLADEQGLPDLLYALKIYLSGDDRFSAIRITGIDEE
ncbi:hypothetical protein GMI69_07640 [Eggerthellaceae bacterium zg-887]|uniref:hypothetical protein n=1 Tax=Xiamenia xianingshaonis TaxID=2682776 RepID=UPI0014095113|nr:hypothetical protein [Xiamenia xianingshaonis]NHM16526.1 hypothetical protein [Xiamenia xianingshaonis]